MGKLTLLLHLFVKLACALAYGSIKDPNFERVGQEASDSPSANQLPIWEATNASSARATNLHGFPVPSLTASLAIGTRGHVLLQDFTLLEKLASFNRERIPDRVVHAKGAGAYGYFKVTHDISKYTKAKFLNGIGKKTPVFVRFSPFINEKGVADTAVDGKGFAIKFYTEDGNHDLVGTTIESFPLRDPMMFVDLVRSRKKNPATNLNDQNAWWDFTSLRPEGSLTVLHLFSDIGRPDGYRRADGFGVHPFKLVNREGEIIFGKFIWRTMQPSRALTVNESATLTVTNPEYNTQDLYDAIARGEYPEWTMYLQLMTLEQARKFRRNPFDLTQIWRPEEFPHIPVGKLVLNRNPANFFAEVEQAAFSPSNMVAGIEPSPDRILAGRLFAYRDAQVYRLGVNHPQLPINRPLAPVNTYLRDGFACHGDNGGGHPHYYPNSFGGHEPDTEGARQVSFSVEGIVDRYDIPEPDEFEGSRLFLERDVGPQEREELIKGIVVRLRLARREIRERTLNNIFYPISEEFGDEVKAALLRSLDELNRNQK